MAARAERPNVLLITSDQHHFSCLGATNPKLRTPALDRLAREGTRFTRAYCPNPVCTPTRASIITGLYPSAHGAWTIGIKLPEDVPTVGQMLSAHGYATGLVGKAHFQPTRSTPESPSLETPPVLRDLDFWRHFRGPWYGFQHVEITRGHGDEPAVGAHYALWMEAHGLANWRDYFRPWPPADDARAASPRRHGAWELPQEFHYTRWTAERAIAFIERAHAGCGSPLDRGAGSLRADAPEGEALAQGAASACAPGPGSLVTPALAEGDGTGSPRPFLLWASFHDPHPPYLVSQPWASMYAPADMEPGELVPGEHDRNPPHFRKTQEERPDFSAYQETPHANHGFRSHRRARAALQQDMATYYGMISFMDREIGRILDRLDQLGLAERTLVVFTTDHGHFLGQHGLVAKGAFHYEDLIRIPFLVRWPGRVPAGRVSDSLQSTVDLAPTFLAATGLPIPGTMQGLSQLPVWRGEAAAVRDHVLVENRHQPTRVHLRTYVDRRYKLTVYRDQPYGELFDLEADPAEIDNRWDDPAAAALKSRLLHAFLNAELRREPMRMLRVSGA